jgi:hypothetical protein
MRIFANGRVGINTTTDAGYQLDVSGTLRSTLGANFATTSGNVGIGTASPANRLDINNANRTTLTSTGGGVNLNYNTSTIGEFATIGFSWESSNDRASRYGMGFTGTNFASGQGDLFLYTNGSRRLNITWDGNVGIGTTTPGYKVDISHSTNGIGGMNVYNGDSGANAISGYRASNANNIGLIMGVTEFNASSAVGGANQSVIYSLGNQNLIFGTNSTERMRITSDGYVLINRTTSIAADYFLQINGQTYGESTVAFKQTGNLAAYFLNTISVTNGATFNAGTAWAGVRSINDMTFNGSVTIPAGAVVGGAVNANRLSFATASNTITMTQSGNNIRAIAGFHVLNQFAGTNNGTITHGAGILVQGVDRVSGASTPTFTNYYGIAINDMNEFSEASFTNRWGVYQVGTTDKNYFAGRTLIGSNVDGGGGQILQVTGDALITGSVRTGAPTSGTSQAWKLGSVVSSSVTLSTGSYVEVEINGTFYRLAIVTPA